jgi:hypothetical protein
LNKGLNQATGDYIGFINSDDYLLPGALISLSTLISTYSEVDVFYGPGYIKNEINQAYTRIYPTKWSLGCYRGGLCVMFQQSIFIRGKYFSEGLRFNERNTTHWDGELMVDLSLKGAFFFRHAIPLAVFRIHGASITGNSHQSESKLRYSKEQEQLRSRIDQEKPGIIRSKIYWMMWLFVMDFRNSVRRIASKLF